MAPLYESLGANGVLEIDQKVLDDMRVKIVDELNKLDEKHNFYIFPRQEVGGGDTSYEFLCQTSSIDFLTKYQFDFNVCIKEDVHLASVDKVLYSWGDNEDVGRKVIFISSCMLEEKCCSRSSLRSFSYLPEVSDSKDHDVSKKICSFC